MASVPALPIARFTVDQYHRMIESGAFTEDDRLELIDGWVVKQMAKGPKHEYAVGQLDELVRKLLPQRWHVRNQAPITLTDSEPEPDLVIARGERGSYRERHPHANEVELVVEVADSSLDVDRVKGRTYANAGIATYWIVNIADRSIEVLANPDPKSETGYAIREIYGPGDHIELRIGGDLVGTIAVDDVLP